MKLVPMLRPIKKENLRGKVDFNFDSNKPEQIQNEGINIAVFMKN